ncbi:MAG: SPOR domain-containing protein [Tannerella sp.]|jgi:cell division septation protein DedD|nr:SPOR domain-containing protein [Tannerella sp.]
MKKILFLSVLSCLLIACFTACKSKQSAYKAAYEQAKERQVTTEQPVQKTTVQQEEITPVNKAKTPAATATRQEKITPVIGEDAAGIKLYSVVVGSFRNKTNAYSLKERMQKDGYMPVLGENEDGMLRVILTSHETRQDADASRAEIRKRYYPDFQDAWILERRY